MPAGPAEQTPVVFTAHALFRTKQRGTDEDAVRKAIREGSREAAQRGLFRYILAFEFGRAWAGKSYDVHCVEAIVAELPDRRVVVTVYTFYY